MAAVLHREDRGQANEGIVEKTARIQEDHVQVLKRDDGTVKNVYLIDKANIHNNRLQVINQYEVDADAASRRTATTSPSSSTACRWCTSSSSGAVSTSGRRSTRSTATSAKLLVRLGPVRVRPALRDQQRHAYEVLLEHDPRVGTWPSRSAARGRRQTSNSFEFTSWWADARTGHRRPDRLHEDVLRQAHAAQHPHPVLRLRRRPQAARDEAVPDRGDRADPSADRDLDQPPTARLDRGRRLRLAHHRLRQDADELQGRPAREPLQDVDKVVFVVDRKTSTTRPCRASS